MKLWEEHLLFLIWQLLFYTNRTNDFGYLYDTMIPNIGIGLSGIIMLVVVRKYRSALIGYDEGEAEILVEGDIIDEF